MDTEVVEYGSQLQISKQEKDREYLKEEGGKVAVIWNYIKYQIRPCVHDVFNVLSTCWE